VRPLACKLPARCRLLALTWESGFPCHSLNRRVSYVVVVSDGGQHLPVRSSSQAQARSSSPEARDKKRAAAAGKFPPGFEPYEGLGP
jgi:hypothetical protein